MVEIKLALKCFHNLNKLWCTFKNTFSFGFYLKIWHFIFGNFEIFHIFIKKIEYKFLNLTCLFVFQTICFRYFDFQKENLCFFAIGWMGRLQYSTILSEVREVAIFNFITWGQVRTCCSWEGDCPWRTRFGEQFAAFPGIKKHSQILKFEYWVF